MKVVLFCGGLGMRLREYSETIPKPMVTVGQRPIIWNLMKYYAHFGHKEFILCLGYKGEMIKSYFLNYNEALSNDFTLSEGGKSIELVNSDIHDWRITFVDTGLMSNIGQRLKAVEGYLKAEKMFLANYTDGLSDLPLDHMLDYFRRADKTACFVSVKPTQSFHVVNSVKDGRVADIEHLRQSGIWINGGFFVFKREIFEHIKPGEELVAEPFKLLIARGELVTYRHTGFWASLDTFKDKQMFDDMYARGEVPWEVWRSEPVGYTVNKPPKTMRRRTRNAKG
jgi:glucose-1-phosphate cytidylyltransferase